jgi:hypothetical protein
VAEGLRNKGARGEERGGKGEREKDDGEKGSKENSRKTLGGKL